MLIAALLFAGAAPADVPPCRLAGSRSASKMSEHRRLRAALGAVMPDTPTMVLLYGSGGHHVTRSYSMIVARGADRIWRGSAVGRDEPWPDPSKAVPLPVSEWTLDAAAAKALSAALIRRCPPTEPSMPTTRQEAPSLGAIAEHIDVVIDGRIVASGAAGEDGEGVSPLIRIP